MQTSLIIPTYNEADNIGFVLASIGQEIDLEILVVDGGSTDQTVVIAKAAGAKVIHEPRSGYGQACATGAAAAEGEFIIFMDGDGADDPVFLPEILTPLLENKADIVLGSRMMGKIQTGAMPWHQYFGNWLSARMIGIIYGIKLSDLSPFRAVRRNKLMELNMQEFTYGWPTEMITKAARLNWRILEIPVDYHKRAGGKSKISGTLRGTVLATFHILKTIFNYSHWEK